MEDTVLMAEGCALEQLVHETANCHGIKGTTIAMRVHVLLEILLAVFKDEDEFRLRMDDIMQADNVGMLELFHKGNFADGSGWRALFGIEVNLLQGHDFVGCSGSSLKGIEEAILILVNRHTL